jgi:O-antigen/teichoic acid export membrane protein
MINLVATIMSYVVSLGVSFLISPYLVKSLGKGTYSFYSISNNFVTYMMILVNALNGMTARFITIEIVKKNDAEANNIFKSVLISNMILCSAFIIPIAFIVANLENILSIPPQSVMDVKLLFVFVCLAMIIRAMTSVYSVSTIAVDRIDLRSYSEIALCILRVLVYTLIFFFYYPRIYYIGIAIVLEAFINMFIQIILTRKLLPQINISKAIFVWKHVKNLLLAGIWNSINSLGNTLLLGMTILLANIFINESASGNISITHMMVGMINGAITAIVLVFIPRLLRKYAQANKEELISEVKKSQKIVGIITNIIIAGIIVLGRDFYSLWMPTVDSGELYVITIIQVIPLLIVGNVWTVYSINMVANKMKTPAIFISCVGLLNIIISLLAVKVLGQNEYAILITSSILSVIYHFVFIPIYGAICINTFKSTFYPCILKSIICTIICSGIGWLIKFSLLKANFSINGWISFFIIVVLLVAVFSVINLFLVAETKDRVMAKEYIARVVSKQ